MRKNGALVCVTITQNSVMMNVTQKSMKCFNEKIDFSRNRMTFFVKVQFITRRPRAVTV